MLHTNHSAAARSTGLAISLLLAIAGCAAGGGSTAPAPCTDCGPTVAPPRPEGLGLTDAPELDVSLGEDPELRASLAASTIRVRPGMDTTLDVRIDRRDVDGEVAVWVEGLPEGLVAEPAVMPAAVPTGRLVIGATAGAALGGPHPFTVVVSASGLEPVVVPARVVVAGAPGSLDETFGEGGIARFELPGNGVNAVGVDSQGRVVVAGRNFAEGRPLIERLRSDGALDAGYGEAARGLAPDHLSSSFGSNLVMVGDEARLLMYAWEAGRVDEPMVGLVGLDETGEANVAIGGNGIVPFGRLDEESNGSVALAAGEGTTFVRVGDRLLAVRPTQTLPLSLSEGAGPSWSMAYHNHTLTFGLYDAASPDRLLQRSHVAGGADRRFGDGGSLRIEDARPSDQRMTHDVRLAADGSGYAATRRWGEGSATAAVVRFTSAGELDEGFGDRGRVRLPEGERVEAMVLDAAERPVVFIGPSASKGLRRYTASGQIDRAFGDAGFVDLGAVGLRATRRIAHDAIADRIVACGYASDGSERLQCARVWL